jgi:hypothetical protein
MNLDWQVIPVFLALGFALWYTGKRVLMPVFSRKKNACGQSGCSCGTS